MKGYKTEKTPELIAKVIRCHLKGLTTQNMNLLGICKESLAREIVDEYKKEHGIKSNGRGTPPPSSRYSR